MSEDETAADAALGGLIREALPQLTAPPGLRAAMRDAAMRDAAPPRMAVMGAGAPRGAIRQSARWLMAASVLVVAAGTSWVLGATHGRAAGADTAREQAIADAVLASHLRSLLASHLTDVASTDRHTVKPWFAGKLDYAPPVADLAAQGFPLIGGRLDYLGGRRVAALVYARGPHTINLFIWPANGDTTAGRLAEHGYTLIRWTVSGMTYWAVSDVDPVALTTFAQLLGSPIKS